MVVISTKGKSGLHQFADISHLVSQVYKKKSNDTQNSFEVIPTIVLHKHLHKQLLKASKSLYGVITNKWKFVWGWKTAYGVLTTPFKSCWISTVV
jgi:hypothetical protein